MFSRGRKKNDWIKSRKVYSGHWRYNRRTAKWCKKCQHQQKYVVLAKCVEDVVRRKEHSFGNRGTRTGWTEHNFRPPLEFFMFILLISNHSVFLVQFGINLHLWVFQKAEIALAEAARAISAFWKTHSCKLIPNWTRNRMITYTYAKIQ